MPKKKGGRHMGVFRARSRSLNGGYRDSCLGKCVWTGIGPDKRERTIKEGVERYDYALSLRLRVLTVR